MHFDYLLYIYIYIYNIYNVMIKMKISFLIYLSLQFNNNDIYNDKYMII